MFLVGCSCTLLSRVYFVVRSRHQYRHRSCARHLRSRRSKRWRCSVSHSPLPTFARTYRIEAFLEVTRLMSFFCLSYEALRSSVSTSCPTVTSPIFCYNSRRLVAFFLFGWLCVCPLTIVEHPSVVRNKTEQSLKFERHDDSALARWLLSRAWYRIAGSLNVKLYSIVLCCVFTR